MFAFVFRRMMDFDHMMPVAVAMAEAGHPVRLGVMGKSLKIESDRRLQLFPTRPQIVSLGKPFAKAKCASFLRNVRCLVMDWAKLDQHETSALTGLARENKIPSISLPHGVDHAVDDIYYTQALNAESFEHFDFVVAPNYLRQRILARLGMPVDRIAVLGSPRFTRAWSDRLAGLYPEVKTGSDDRLKIAFFDIARPVRYTQAISTLYRLNELPFAKLKIQPKPSNVAPSEEVLSELFHEQIDMTHASQLCRWADVVLGMSSSVLFEVFLHRKHLVYLSHLEPIKVAFQTYQACWIAEDDNRLVDLLERLHANPKIEMPNPQPFMRDILHGGKEERDVSGAYVEFLAAVADRHSQRVSSFVDKIHTPELSVPGNFQTGV